MAAPGFSVSDLLQAASHIQPLLWTCSECSAHIRSFNWIESCPECGHGKCNLCNEGLLPRPESKIDAIAPEKLYVAPKATEDKWRGQDYMKGRDTRHRSTIPDSDGELRNHRREIPFVGSTSQKKVQRPQGQLLQEKIDSSRVSHKNSSSLQDATVRSAQQDLKLGKELTCVICTEILFQPLTLMDCLHTFCGECLKDWFSFQLAQLRSSQKSLRPGSTLYTCPSCRAPIRETKHNQTVTTLLEMFVVSRSSQSHDHNLPQSGFAVSTKVPVEPVDEGQRSGSVAESGPSQIILNSLASPQPQVANTVNAALMSTTMSGAIGQRKNVDKLHSFKLRNDKEIHVKDLKRLADSSKLESSATSDLVSMISKDAAKPSKGVNSGCKTCKTRHVKCDERRPAPCQRCVKSGFSCDGYTVNIEPRTSSSKTLGVGEESKERSGRHHEIHDTIEPQPEVADDRIVRELRKYKGAILDLQAQIRGAAVRTQLGNVMQRLVNCEDTVIELQSRIRGASSQQIAGYRLNMREFAVDLQNHARGFLVRQRRLNIEPDGERIQAAIKRMQLRSKTAEDRSTGSPPELSSLPEGLQQIAESSTSARHPGRGKGVTNFEPVELHEYPEVIRKGHVEKSLNGDKEITSESSNLDDDDDPPDYEQAFTSVKYDNSDRVTQIMNQNQTESTRSRYPPHWNNFFIWIPLFIIFILGVLPSVFAFVLRIASAFLTYSTFLYPILSVGVFIWHRAMAHERGSVEAETMTRSDNTKGLPGELLQITASGATGRQEDLKSLAHTCRLLQKGASESTDMILKARLESLLRYSTFKMFFPERENPLLFSVTSFLLKRGIGGMKKLPPQEQRLYWTCSCGYKSQDDFQELRPGAVVEFANDLFKAGYITHAQVSNEARGRGSALVMKIGNLFGGAKGRIRTLRSTPLPFFSKPSSIKSVALMCLPAGKCRWLHLCLKKRPYATKLAPLHVCKDDEQNDFTDASFFKALRKAYYSQRNWREKLLFKLRKIAFVEFELCPEDFVDGIIPDQLPPTIEEYDFQPPPPLKKVPPIGPEHMMHLFTSCSSQPLSTSMYLRYVPKRKKNALSFLPDRMDGNTGWGLHFVESPNSSLAVTVMFVLSSVLGIVFAVFWIVYKKDVQGAFGVAAYVTSTMTLAVMSWQMWAA